METLVSSSFGELLRAFRKRRLLTQQDLAIKLSLHRNTIGTWEQGEFLPASRGMVLELARQLSLNEHETSQLLEASLTALPLLWHVPYLRNPFFTGRADLLEELHRRLVPARMVTLSQSHALYGLGGIGKTQLALEYAYRHALEYAAVFWISAENRESITTSFLTMATLLNLPERLQEDQQQMILAVQRWLSTHSKWLLIWDNVEDIELLQTYLSTARQGAILITTRHQAQGTLAQGIELQIMGHEEAMLLLLRRAKILSPHATNEQIEQLARENPTEYMAAQELVTRLGGLPLALDQAGAYLEETGCGLAGYLQRYTHHRGAQLLARRGALCSDHPHSVTTTFVLASQCVEQNPLASNLLRLCTFLHAEAIPEELFETDKSPFWSVSGDTVSDPTRFDMAIAALRSFSLVQRHPETNTLSLHRLVQAVLREAMDECERTRVQQRTIQLLNATFPEVTPDVWSLCERLMAHVLTCAATVTEGEETVELAELLHKAAHYLLERARYQEAGPLFLRALRIREHQQGLMHLDLATLLNHMAVLSYRQSKYEQAEELYKRALHIRQQTLGPEHPDTVSLLNNLAILSYEQGKYEQAESMYLQALQIWEQSLGPEHSLTARALYGLANLYSEQSRYEQAEPLYQRALHICEQTLGPEHPNVAYPLSGLAILYNEQGRYEQAEELYKRALSIREQTLGPEHPLLASILNHLATLSFQQGKETLAEGLYQRALHIREQALGPQHPGIASVLNGLAVLYTQQQKYKEAEFLYQRTLTIREQHLGQQHPDTARSLIGLADLYQKQGHDKQALPLLLRACTVLEQCFGMEHPETVRAQNDYHSLLQRQQRRARQEKDYQDISVSEVPSEKTRDIGNHEPGLLAAFLADCCEFHPLAWSYASELWDAYELWVKEHEERFSLSRRAFTTQLKAYGCRADRTKTSRLWRGIALLQNDPGKR